MIGEMIGTLKKEQSDENDKQQFCTKQFDSADDQKKGLERKASDLDTTIAKEQDALATLSEEIKAIEDGIKALDKSVAEATQQRKEENTEFSDLLASNTAAKELLGMAKTRLNAFYHPSKVEPEEPSSSLAQVREHQQDAPPAAPDAGGYAKNKDESDSVLSMIDTLIKDVEKDITVAKTTEKDSQADYERAMKNSAEKRALASKQLTDKGAAKAAVEADNQDSKADRSNAAKELMANGKFIANLHAECDFLLQYFDVRKQARDGEISSLENAKNVLLGADFSLVQESRSLRGIA